VMDDDIYGRLARIARGIEVNPQTLALDVIAAVGPSHHFLTEAHTLEYLRREFSFSTLATRFNSEAWMEAGAQDAPELAAERVKSILQSEPESRLEPHVLAEFERILSAAHAA